MAVSIVLMSACPINLFDPILLYLMPKLKRYSGRKPPRPVYVKALYLQQQKTKALFHCGGKLRCAFYYKQCLSMIQPIYTAYTVHKLKRLRSTQPHPSCLRQCCKQYFNAGDVAFCC